MGLKDRMKDAAVKAGSVAKEKTADALERRAEQKQADDAAEVARRASQAEDDAARTAAFIFQGTSHDEGKNATITLYRDRIERVKDRSALSLSKAAQDTEVIPISAVSSVQAKKAGMRTNVTVYASANAIGFRFDHGQAQAFKDAVMKLILERDTGPATSAAPAASLADELAKLAGLRDSGVLSGEEFEAQKARLLQG